MKKFVASALTICVVFAAGCAAAESEAPEPPEEIANQVEEPAPQVEGRLVENAGSGITVEEMLRELTRPRLAEVQNFGLIFGYGIDRVSEMRYDTRSWFESMWLPRTLLELEGFIFDQIFVIDNIDIIDYIASENIAGIQSFAQMVWETVTELVIRVELANLFEGFATDDEAMALFRENTDILRKALGLTAEQHILGVEIKQLGEGISAAIITMYCTGWNFLSSYIGVVYSDLLGLGYYLFERDTGQSDDEAMYRLSFVLDVVDEFGLTSSRSGEFQTVESTREAFIEAILLDIEIRLAD